MSLNLIRRGGGILRYLHRSDALARPARVVITNGHVRRICLPANRRLANPLRNAIRPSSIVSRPLLKSFATASDPDEDTKPTKSKNGSKSGRKTREKSSKKTEAKPKPKLRSKMTEKQKEAQKAKQLREQIKELKVASLQPPKKLLEAVWNLAIKMKLPEVQGRGLTGQEAFKEATQMAKLITPEEREQIAAQAKANKAINEATYTEWVRSYTPLQIKEANAARRKLARITNTKVRLIRDDRLVKKPLPAYMRYMMERTQEGDFKYMKVSDIATRVAEEWKGLTSTEKEKYLRQAELDREQYRQQCREVYGEEPHSTSASETA